MAQSIAHRGIPFAAKAANEESCERQFAIEGITCAVCVQTIEDGLADCPGVEQARVNYSTQRLTVRWKGGPNAGAQIAERVRKLGYRAHPLRKTVDDSERKYAQWLLRCLAVSGFAAMNVMLLSVSVWSGNATDITIETRDFFHWLSALIVLPAVSYAGQPFFRSAIGALRTGRVNMDVPISLGIMLALGLSLYETSTHGIHAYFDSAIMLVFFLLVGRYLEQVTRQRMRTAAHNISSLRASAATRIEDGRLVLVEADDLRPGDIVLVRPGDRFPADGVIVDGVGTIDESIATGETAGVPAKPGGKVLAGTMSLDGSFRVKIHTAARNSFVENLERLIDTAVESRLPYMQIANRAARLYAPIVHLTALLTLAGWLLAGAGFHTAIVTAIAVLIITCPCALALAVPTVQVVSMGEMFRQRVLVNDADLTERLAEADTVVFDKTGTLTMPETAVCNMEEIAGHLQRIAARLAAGSRHPLARAIARMNGEPMPFANITEEPGRGVRAVADGVEVRLGSAAFCDVTPDEASFRADTSSIYLRAGDRVAEFRVGQRIRQDAAKVVSELKRRGYSVMILSGDRAGPVESVARSLGIDAWTASCTPDRKITELERLRNAGHKVLMVGDGLNDAPALAAAYVSLSPISAADLTQAHADGMFLGDSLRPVLDVIDIAKQAKRIMLQNLALAVVYNVIAIPLAIAGYVTPLVAAAAMSGSSILVSTNALRAKRWKVENSSPDLRRNEALAS